MAVWRHPEDVAATVVDASTPMAGTGDDGDSDGGWAGLAAGGDAGGLPGVAGFGDLAGDVSFGDLAGDADSGALVGVIDAGCGDIDDFRNGAGALVP